MKVPLTDITIGDSTLLEQIPIHVGAGNGPVTLEQDTYEFSLRMRQISKALTCNR